MTAFSVGFGYDVHKLAEDRLLILGGVEIPYSAGLEGHSDADVLAHAVIDAIIGALGRGDIGQRFPDTDPTYKGASSLGLLQKTMTWIKQEGARINNLDATIVAQTPKLSPYIPSMREKLAGILDVTKDKINIKAKTTEGLGFCGRQEGIAAYAVVSVIN
jgi:2-C-methyl-D-erythritol 2,4-cyclodiphosphate synthase